MASFLGSRSRSTLAIALSLFAACGRSTRNAEPADSGVSDGTDASGGTSATGGAAATGGGVSQTTMGSGGGGDPGWPACVPDPTCGSHTAIGEAIECQIQVTDYCQGGDNSGIAIPIIDCEPIARLVETGVGGAGGEGAEIGELEFIENYVIDGDGVLTLSEETCERARQSGRLDVAFSCVTCT